MRLVEPIGILTGSNAQEAVRSGLALPLLGGSASFVLARIYAPGQAPVTIRATDVPVLWREALDRVTCTPPTAGLPAGPLVMGIVNATPDSFSDAGCHLDPAAGITAGMRFVSEGAAILDIGGESTRPQAVPPSVDDEIARVLPIVRGLAGTASILSIDTRRAPVMAAALDAGARMINDVSALAFDPEAIPLLASHSCTVALMHMRGTPGTMQTMTSYGDVAVDTVRELAARVEAAVARGIDRSRIVVDPGIGFAKTGAQSAELLRRLPILANLGCRVLLGVSRKSFIGRLANEPTPDRRTAGSLAAAAAALALPGLILRVHDVRATNQFVQVMQGIG